MRSLSRMGGIFSYEYWFGKERALSASCSSYEKVVKSRMKANTNARMAETVPVYQRSQTLWEKLINWFDDLIDEDPKSGSRSQSRSQSRRGSHHRSPSRGGTRKLKR